MVSVSLQVHKRGVACDLAKLGSYIAEVPVDIVIKWMESGGEVIPEGPDGALRALEDFEQGEAALVAANDDLPEEYG
jgi:hypothetical protein